MWPWYIVKGLSALVSFPFVWFPELRKLQRLSFCIADRGDSSAGTDSHDQFGRWIARELERRFRWRVWSSRSCNSVAEHNYSGYGAFRGAVKGHWHISPCIPRVWCIPFPIFFLFCRDLALWETHLEEEKKNNKRPKLFHILEPVPVLAFSRASQYQFLAWIAN